MVATVAVATPVVVVVIIPPWLVPDIAPAIVATPSLLTLAHRVRSSIAPVKLPVSFAVWRAANSTVTLQKGEVFHYLKMVAQEVDMATLEVDWVVAVW
jgi:hypothetical protein